MTRMKAGRPLARFAAIAAAALLFTTAKAENAPFDLVGPKVDVRVTRGEKTLPIAQVPNLQPGDKLWVKADLPDSQKNHLLLIVAFLRGTTNEPPDSWFTEIDTWDRKHTAEGTTVRVPEGAEQALLFIAPETGGDFKTLRSAVKGKPGLFIRADSDLNEASFEQQRIERYLAAMKKVQGNDPKEIHDHSAKLASTLALKPNADCFKQPVEAQVNCLTQSSAPVLLSDGHGQSIAESLSSGPSSDFINAASYTGAAGGGLYSAYVGAVVDLVHLVSALHTAKYQYIPGLSFPRTDSLQLKLNAPVSFVDPKSVIVIGLPAIQKAVTPPLHAHDPHQVACLLQPHMALQVEGAPLVFSTSFAHDLTLHLNRSAGAEDIPLTPDAFEGGLVVAPAEERKPLKEQNAPTEAKGNPSLASPSDLMVTGTVRGFWGFDPFDGPTLTLQQQPGKGWKIVSGGDLLAGQDNHLTLAGDGTACVEHIDLTSAKDSKVEVSFQPGKEPARGKQPELALNVPLKKLQPGGYALAIQQFGSTEEEKVSLKAYTGDIHLTSLKIHQGDRGGELSGEGLENVAQVSVAGTKLLPSGDVSDGSLKIMATSDLPENGGPEATVELKDGRTMTVKVERESPRPSLTVTSLDVIPTPAAGGLKVSLDGKGQIPLRSTVHFVVTTQQPFPRDEKVEVASPDGALHKMLSLADNSLVLQDPHTAIATLDPFPAFGQSAFGLLRVRPVAADGTAGDWSPLGTLVRTPQLSSVQCQTSTGTTEDLTPCTLNGSELFLVQSVSAAKDFAHPVTVPSGFAQGSIAVPAPADGSTLYLRLRDDPSATASVSLPKPLPNPSAVGAGAGTGGAASSAPLPAAATPAQASATAPPSASH